MSEKLKYQEPSPTFGDILKARQLLVRELRSYYKDRLLNEADFSLQSLPDELKNNIDRAYFRFKGPDGKYQTIWFHRDLSGEPVFEIRKGIEAQIKITNSTST